MADPQITLRELLADPTYRKWFAKPPKLTNFSPSGRPYRVYVQRELDGSWAQAAFPKYADAYRYIAKHLRVFHDMAIATPGQAFHPPVLVSKEPVLKRKVVQLKGGKTKIVRRYVYERSYWRPALELLGHQWCPYCRRPTVFAYFAKHHTVKNCIPYEMRCTICGVRRTFIKDYWAIQRLKDIEA
jgi:hypothetical protein